MMPDSDLRAIAWPLERLGEALEALVNANRPRGSRMRIGDRRATLPSTALGPTFIPRVTWWIEDVCRGLGARATECTVQHGALRSLLERRQPSLVAMAGREEEPTLFLAVVSGRSGYMCLASPDGNVVPVPATVLEGVVAQHTLARMMPQVRRRFEELREGVSERASTALLNRSLAPRFGCYAWKIEIGGDASVETPAARQLAVRGVVVLAMYASEVVLAVGGWRLIGASSPQGRVEPGWVAAWGLILATIIVAHVVASRQAARIARDVGVRLRRKLLAGALNLDPGEIRREGFGQLLGRALEVDSMEGLAIGGTSMTISVLFELTLSFLALVVFARSIAFAVTLVATLALGALLVLRYTRALRDAVTAKRGMTRALVEEMIGHRTTVAQRAFDRWRGDEDGGSNACYEDAAAEVDRYSAWLAILSHAWNTAAFATLASSLLVGDHDTASIAIAIGGILVGGNAFAGFGLAMPAIAGAMIAWTEVKGIFAADGRPVEQQLQVVVPYETVASHGNNHPVLVARDVVARQPGRSAAVIDSVRFEIAVGDHVLIE